VTDRGEPMAALTLVASLRAALMASRSVADRRAGRSGTVEEPPEAVEALCCAGGRIRSGLSRLRARLALGAPDDAAGSLVQAFRDRLLAADLAADLSEAHRHLLTLYPAIEAEVIEATRLAAVEADRLAGAIDFEASASPLAGRLEQLFAWLPDAS
jgi:hypothetical protein